MVINRAKIIRERICYTRAVVGFGIRVVHIGRHAVIRFKAIYVRPERFRITFNILLDARDMFPIHLDNLKHLARSSLNFI